MTEFVNDPGIRSWGRVLAAAHRVARPAFRDELGALLAEGGRDRRGVLPIGLKRSYGESGLNADGLLVDMTRLDRLISFDAATGIVHAEAGVSLAQLLDFAVPRGFFPPVTPGTRFVTLGGAVANDVHGKNHTRAGTFGCHVRGLGLLRSDGAHHALTPDDPSGLFAATIGGMGLTGIVTDVAVQLRPIPDSRMDVETLPFGHVRDFFALSADSAGEFEHMVAWIDCLAGGDSLGRGIFTRGNHATGGTLTVERKAGPPLPVDLPGFALNAGTVSAFNALFHQAQRLKAGKRRVGYGGFFYPLDGIANWNRLYGKRGFYQYQSVIAPAAAEAATIEMLKQTAKAGQGSFLVVLKTFGGRPSPGLMSFPTEGTTLALDFPNKGAVTLALLDRLDAVVKEAGGRLYPAKDGRMPRELFLNGYPRLDAFRAHLDPAFQSSFWRRMKG